MARPRKHTDTREKALRRIAAGESPNKVGADMGIAPSTLRTWLLRGEGVRGDPEKSPPAPSASMQRRETRESTGIDLTTIIEELARMFVAHVVATKDMIAPGADKVLISQRLAWEGTTARGLLALRDVGVPKVTVEQVATARGLPVEVMDLVKALESAKE
jgi:hypothetical protein